VKSTKYFTGGCYFPLSFFVTKWRKITRGSVVLLRDARGGSYAKKAITIILKFSYEYFISGAAVPKKHHSTIPIFQYSNIPSFQSTSIPLPKTTNKKHRTKNTISYF